MKTNKETALIETGDCVITTLNLVDEFDHRAWLYLGDGAALIVQGNIGSIYVDVDKRQQIVLDPKFYVNITEK